MKVRLVSRHAMLMYSVAEHLAANGFADTELASGEAERLELRHRAGIPYPEIRKLLTVLRPLTPDVVQVPDLEVDVQVALGSPAPLADFRLTIHADSADLADWLREEAATLGYSICPTELKILSENELRYGGATPLARQALCWLLARRGIAVPDAKRWGDEDHDLWLYAMDPEARTPAHRARLLRVEIRTDDRARGERLRGQLEKLGFGAVEVSEQGLESLQPFLVRYGALAVLPEVLTQVHTLVEDAALDLGALPAFPVVLEESLPRSTGDVWVDLPTRGLADGSLARLLAAPGRYNVLVSTANEGGRAALLERLRPLGFASLRDDADDHTEAALLYGGAPDELVERLRTMAQEVTGLDVTATRRWSHGDHDIWFNLPETWPRDGARPVVRTGSSAPAAGAPLHDWLAAAAGPAADLPFLAVDAATVRVGHVGLPRRTGQRSLLAPHPTAFAHYCVDQLTAENLEHVALAVELREPCLLEGETSTSKTSCVLYLAALLGQPVVRLNLNGQTDTGELVGRFQPQQLASDLPVAADELRAASGLLEPESRIILSLAATEGRPLTPVEVQQVMANERMVSHPWRWHDGIVVKAMRQGWWVLLDELNLAEPQILERLNSVLERDPSLVLSEHDDSVIGSTSDPVHPDFRIFATMNPAEYAGRSVLSPAYRNRWRAYRQVRRPTEVEYYAMLRYLVHGVQPEVDVAGRHYRGGRGPAALAGLARLDGVDDILVALARFHTGLEVATGSAEGTQAAIGSHRREHYVFTRRDLLSVVEYLASPACTLDGTDPTLALREALVRYYLERLATAGDRQVVTELLDACGIGPTTWAVGQPPETIAREREPERP